jgi:GNAT superfamily N-acetyltransferase
VSIGATAAAAPATVCVREAMPADRAAVRACMLEVFRESGARKAAELSSALWEWQYLKGEHGSLIALAEDAHGVCGYYHAVLLPLRDHGRAVRGAMVQDVGTLSSHRGQGVFREMGAFMLGALKSRGISLIYTFPNARSLPSFLRNHSYDVIARVPIYLAPLRIGSLASARLRLTAAGPALDAVADPIYRAVSVRGARLERAETVEVLRDYDEEVAAVAAAFAGEVRDHLDRTSKTLEWRYREKPDGGYTGWGLRRGGQLVAFAITRAAHLFDSPATMFMDFGCHVGEAAALRRLVWARMEADRLAGHALAVVAGLHPQLAEWRRIGFVRLPERFNPRPLNLVVKPLDGTTDALDPASWLITLGDWDVF